MNYIEIIDKIIRPALYFIPLPHKLQSPSFSLFFFNFPSTLLKHSSLFSDSVYLIYCYVNLTYLTFFFCFFFVFCNTFRYYKIFIIENCIIYCERIYGRFYTEILSIYPEYAIEILSFSHFVGEEPNKL